MYAVHGGGEFEYLKDVWIYSTQIYSGVLALILRVRGGQLAGAGLGLGAPGWAC